MPAIAKPRHVICNFYPQNVVLNGKFNWILRVKMFGVKAKEEWFRWQTYKEDFVWKFHFQSEYSLLSLAKLPENFQKGND